METSNLPDSEFKTLVIRMINNLSENFNKEIGNIKKNHWNEECITGKQNRIDEKENQTSILEDKEAENTQSAHEKEKRIKKSENSLRSLWDNSKCTNIHIMGVPEEREQGIENPFEKNND